MNLRVLSVTSLNNYIKKILDADFILNSVKVQGEVSNFKAHSSGHLYFTLKDPSSRVSCVMFRQERQKLLALPQDGDQVTLTGRVSTYVQGGNYQIYVEDIQGEGTGDLYQRFLNIKEKLAAQGLFDEAKRKPIPAAPRRIAVITSPTGAAIRDIIKVARTRNLGQSLVIWPVQVQGATSEAEIIRAIRAVNLRDDIDTIIIARGGGSIEDLWSFNSEALAYAISDSRIPVVTGIGHDIDFTIADFAADLRAATPSQAAELTIPNTAEQLSFILEARRRFLNLMAARLRQDRAALAMNQRFIRQNDPRLVIVNELRALEELRGRLSDIMARGLEREKASLERSRALLKAYSPLNVLDKGYAIVRNEANEVLSSTAQLESARVFKIRVRDGEAVFEKGDPIHGSETR